MKTKELIRLLQEADPTGEVECCVDNADIHFVEKNPAYWDGCYTKLIRDDSKKPYYDVVGARIVSEGEKVVIRYLSAEDVIEDNSDVLIEYDSDYSKKHFEDRVKGWRDETDKINKSIDYEHFQEWVFKKIETEDGVSVLDKVIVENFYNENISYKDKMPKDIRDMHIIELHGEKEWKVIPSWLERRIIQWEREIEIDLKEGKICLKKKL